VQRRAITDGPSPASQALRSIAIVAGAVVLVLTLLALAVYVVVYVDLVPQMQ
jgi:hypothetical protein